MTVIFPGSFDPVTWGHVDIVRRAERVFGTVLVAVLNHPEKKPMFTIDERLEMLRGCLEGVTVEAYNGLLVSYAKERGANVVMRSLRSPADCAYELPMAQANRHLSAKGIETVTFFADPAYAYVSSSLVREALAAGVPPGDAMLDAWVPPFVKKMLCDIKIGGRQ
jgi:pantetheine-phosphate adenylyltransferase